MKPSDMDSMFLEETRHRIIGGGLSPFVAFGFPLAVKDYRGATGNVFLPTSSYEGPIRDFGFYTKVQGELCVGITKVIEDESYGAGDLRLISGLLIPPM
tara:strand:+ start:3027 stop:3323 length:297 start_codon:yes stop_codon:yes gene_type:complete